MDSFVDEESSFEEESESFDSDPPSESELVEPGLLLAVVGGVEAGALEVDGHRVEDALHRGLAGGSW